MTVKKQVDKPISVKKYTPNVVAPAETDRVNAIIYGVTGVGKTHLLGSAAECEEMSPALLLDFEKGTRTLVGVDIDIVRPASWSEIQDLYFYLLHDNDKYKSVLLDSATEIQKKYSLGKIMGDMQDNDMTYRDLSTSVNPDRQAWGRTGGQMRKVFHAFRDLAYLDDESKRIHVIFTALETYREKRDIFCPNLIGALAEDCGAVVDFLFRLSRVNVPEEDEEDGSEIMVLKRHLLTDDYISEDGTQYMGKNRGKGMPKGIWEPTMQKIINAIQGKN